VRPVNLIPEEQRPGSQRPLRAGPLAYVIVGVLAMAVIGVTLVVVTDGQISERKAEVSQLKVEEQKVKAEAQSLAAYTEFHNVREQRVATMASLADSRFNWPRVMHELSLVLPVDVHLSTLTASVSSTASAEGGSAIAMRSAIAGPALEMVGCASSQAAVGGFVDALKDIDGVTRVGVQGSAIGGESGSGTAAASTCAAGKDVAQFQMVVAFDAAPVPEEAGAEAGEVAPAPESTEAATSESTSSESSTSEGGEG
jgi:Tfp pilus assembly protein PilN